MSAGVRNLTDVGLERTPFQEMTPRHDAVKNIMQTTSMIVIVMCFQSIVALPKSQLQEHHLRLSGVDITNKTHQVLYLLVHFSEHARNEFTVKKCLFHWNVKSCYMFTCLQYVSLRRHNRNILNMFQCLFIV